MVVNHETQTTRYQGVAYAQGDLRRGSRSLLVSNFAPLTVK